MRAEKNTIGAIERSLWGSLLVVLQMAGCNWGSTSDTIPVSGVVTLDGQPVEGATVSFHAIEEGKPSAYGRTKADGSFLLQTHAVNDGAVPGEFAVTIQKVHITPDEFEREDPRWKPPPPPEYLVPQKYSDRHKSGLTASVVKGENNEFPYDLKK